MAVDRGPGSVATLTTAVPDASPLACQQCGGLFIPRRRRKDTRFCSARCRARWHADRRVALLAELDELLTRAAQVVRELREGPERLTG